MIAFGSDALRAAVDPFGAELSSLTDADGRELMTNADPAYWTGRAPILFPIVGGLVDDTYRLDGETYRMAKHGFARRSEWEVVAVEDASARFRLTDSAETHAHYPFAFALELTFVVEGARLGIAAELVNTGDRDLPASFGYHPAFAWPSPFGAPRGEHRLVFESDEPGDLLALAPDGTIAGTRASPLDGRVLHLDDALFADDALIWSPVASRALTYGVEGAPRLRIDWEARELGVWTKPGSAFVCVEPWWGHADPHGFAGEIWDKPGIMRIAPGERRRFAMGVTLVA